MSALLNVSKMVGIKAYSQSYLRARETAVTQKARLALPISGVVGQRRPKPLFARF
jgi:hypothetical protein